MIVGRRHDHPPPRRRHRPQAVVRPGDRRGGRVDPARGQGRAGPDRRPQPRGAGPVTRHRSRSWSTRPRAVARRPGPWCRSRGCCGTPGAGVEVTYSPGPQRDAGPGLKIAVDRGDVVVSVGGDGMLSSLAGAVSRADGTLAVVPAGRGNDFARMLGLPDDPAGQARVLLSGEVRRVDLLSWTRRRCLAPGRRLGLRGRRRPRRRRSSTGRSWLPKSMQYPYAAVRALATYRPGRYRLSVDGAEREYAAATVVVANSAYYGKGMRIAPAATVDDGLLDVVVIEAASRVALMRALPTVYDGAHVSRDDVTVLTGKRVELSGRSRTPIPVGGGRRAPGRPARARRRAGGRRDPAGRAVDRLLTSGVETRSTARRTTRPAARSWRRR